MDIDQLKEKTNYVSITGIIRKSENGKNKYLICKRSPNEKAFPNKWCVPGGKIEQKDFINTPKDTKDHWLDIFEKTLKKEILEETNLKIKNTGYVSSLVFIRPNGFSTIIVSLYADYDSGDVKLSDEELVDYAWVDLEEAKRYNLIENIYEQIVEVEEKFERFNLLPYRLS
ncbi:MAG: NUDIX domain-containing protein [Candidatus Woesearchaeota archaeon]